MLTQILRRLFSHTKDGIVSVSREVFCHRELKSAYCLHVAFLPLEVCTSLNELIAAVLLKLPFLISYRKSLNCCYKSTSTLE